MNAINKHLVEFGKLVVDAFDSIPQDYYKLKTTYNVNGIVRERLFCYELYHRIRCLQEIKQMTDFSIHGEIDKRGHELFAKCDQKNPDFVFHTPGSMDGNLLVVEVKGEIILKDACKDLRTLRNFCEKYRYGKGLWLVYNYSCDEIEQFFNNHNFKLYNGFQKIEMVCKKTADSLVECRMLNIDLQI